MLHGADRQKYASLRSSQASTCHCAFAGVSHLRDRHRAWVAIDLRFRRDWRAVRRGALAQVVERGRPVVVAGGEDAQAEAVGP